MRNNFNPWHLFSPGDQLHDIVNGIIEIPKGIRAKYELDKESGLLKLDRVIYSSVYYRLITALFRKATAKGKNP